jgi:hypothetical protein
MTYGKGIRVYIIINSCESRSTHSRNLACSAALVVATLTFAATGCATEDVLSNPENNSVGVTAQAFTEPTCGAVPEDGRSPGPEATATSLDAAYNHTQCTNSYAHVIASTSAEFRAFATYAHPIVPPTGPISGCNGMWANMSLWKLNGSAFTKVAAAPFTVGAAAPDGATCLPPYTEIQIPTAGTYKVVAQAGFAISFQSVTLGTYRADVHNMSTHDDRGYTGDGDWAVGLFKGECATGLAIGGVSRITGSGVRNVYCNEPLRPTLVSDTTLNFTTFDDRRSTAMGDWDFGFLKGQCPAHEVMTGLAQTSNGVISKARCAPLSGADGTDSCEQRIFSSADSRGSLKGGDWSVGDTKGQCPADKVVTGISKDAIGRPRSVLCCRPFRLR